MDSTEDIWKDLVQFAQFAVRGDANGARIFGMRRVRELKKTDPALAHSLRQALTSVPPLSDRHDSAAGSIRRADPTWSSAPADSDAKMDLLRIEKEPVLVVDPVYTANVRSALGSLVKEHRDPAKLEQSGLSPTRTVLLSGPPGVGKTLAARWMAQQLGRPLLVLDLGTVMSRYLGATGVNLKRAIAFARHSNGILFLDELDALAKRRDDAGDVGELKRLVTVLLQELDDWPQGRLLLAATNHPQLLDDAVWRRFETRIELSRPTEEDLRSLITSLVPNGIAVPEVWTAVLPAMYAGTSHGDFTQAFLNLRKLAVLDPELTAAEALMRAISARLSKLSRKEAKKIALTLAKDRTLSLRKISEVMHVSRDTLRRSGVKGGR